MTTRSPEWCAAIAAAQTAHGHYVGGKKSPTYHSWTQMKQRCRNRPGWADRGISVCERWQSFENFLADMGERPEGLTLDRIDNDGHYEPSNCRWATKEEQRRNRQDSRLTLDDVVWIRANAGKIPQPVMGERFGISRSAISHIVTGRSYR